MYRLSCWCCTTKVERGGHNGYPTFFFFFITDKLHRNHLKDKVLFCAFQYVHTVISGLGMAKWKKKSQDWQDREIPTNQTTLLTSKLFCERYLSRWPKYQSFDQKRHYSAHSSFTNHNYFVVTEMGCLKWPTKSKIEASWKNLISELNKDAINSFKTSASK